MSTERKDLTIEEIKKMPLEEQFDLLYEMLDTYDWCWASQISVLDEIRVKVGLEPKYYKQNFPNGRLNP